MPSGSTSPIPRRARSRRIGELLGLHRLAIEDTREFGQRPKVDVYDDHVLLVFYTARLEESGSVRPIEVHVYLADDYVLTVRREPCLALDELRERVQDDPEHPIYEIFDTLTDAFYPVIERLEERIDQLEGEVLNRTRREQLTTIYRLRQEVRELSRLVSVQRDEFQSASDDLQRLISLGDARIYLRDIADHLDQVAGELHRQNEDLAALTSTYFNANADRLNAIAARLTIVGTLFVAVDAGDRVLRPELRLAGGQHRHPQRFPDVRHRRPRRAHRDPAHSVLGQAARLVLIKALARACECE